MEQNFLNDLKASEETFQGWDFSYISETGRASSSILTWSYGSFVRKEMAAVKSMLDMGTGGGELLSYFQPFPPIVKATEGYKPNVPIAKKRLEPLGVSVYEIENDDDLPFEEQEFELIVNKHESFDANEVYRILKQGGTFITQQVGGDDCFEINEWFDTPLTYDGWNLANAQKQLEDAGFDVTYAKEEYPIQRFYDLGALLYYLKAIPWQLENWNQNDHTEKLYDIYQQISRHGFIDVSQHRFILRCVKK